MNSDQPPIPLDSLLDNLDGMRRLARSLIRDPALADDVAQDAVLVALSKGPRHRANFEGWLKGIVRNVARDAERSARRRARYENAAESSGNVCDPLNRAVQAEEQKRLVDALQRLPEPYREVVWRRYMDGAPVRRIAREAGVPVETVRTRLKRARAMLRQRLDSVHGSNRRAWALALAPLAGSKPWGSAISMGGILLTTKGKVGALAAFLVLAGSVAWWVGRSNGEHHTLPAAGEQSGAAGGPVGSDSAGPRLRAGGSNVARDETDKPAGTMRVEGVVVDGAERPLVGVQIYAGASDMQNVAALRRVAKSEAGGRFVFYIQEDTADFRVAARAEGRLDAGRLIRSNENRSIILRLPKTPVYVFRFLDKETDEPLVGVRCEVVRKHGSLAWVRSERTNNDGIVSLPSPTADELDDSFRVNVLHPGYRTLHRLNRPSTALGFGTPERPREVYLERAPRLVFVAHSPDGDPIPGVRIRAWAGNPGDSTLQPEWSMDTIRSWHDGTGDGVVLGDAVTGEDGRVHFDAGPDRMAWWAHASNGELVGLAQGAGRWKGREMEVAVEMHAAVRLVGRVSDASGAPVARARVACTPWVMAQRMRPGRLYSAVPDVIARLYRTMTDENGNYVLNAVPIAPPPSRLFVSAARGDLGSARAEIRITSSPGAAQRNDLVLDTEFEVQAVLVADSAGEPIAGALVTYGNYLPGMLTDKHGRARLVRHELPPNETAKIRAFKRGYAIGKVERPALGTEAKIVLAPAASLRGRVVESSGRPRGAFVDVYEPAVAELPPDARRTQFMKAAWLGRARAASNGYFRLDRLPPGPFYIRFWYKTTRDGKRRSVVGEQLVPGGEPCELMFPESQSPRVVTGGTIEGSVVDESGRVLTRYGLLLRGKGGVFGPTLRGRRFVFENVPPGEWRLHAEADGGGKQAIVPVFVRPGDTAYLRVVVGEAQLLRGRLVDVNGRGVSGTTILVTRKGMGNSWSSAVTGSDGSFAIENLLPGQYRARLRRHTATSSYYVSDDYFEVRGDQTEEVVLTAHPAGSLVLVSDDDRFMPYEADWHKRPVSREKQRTLLSSVTVVAANGEELRGGNLFCGRMRFDYPLAPGSYQVTVTAYGERTFTASFTVSAGRETVVRVILPK